MRAKITLAISISFWMLITINAIEIFEKCPNNKDALNKEKMCLSVCSGDLINFYNKHNKVKEVDLHFTKDVILNNGAIKAHHLIRDFNHVVRKNCEKGTFLEADNKWILFQNGTLFEGRNRTFLNQTGYCFDVQNNKGDNDFSVNPRICDAVWKFDTSTFGVIFSYPFYIITIAIYLSIKRLRKNTYGKCFISFLSSQIMMSSLSIMVRFIQVKDHPTFCQIYGYVFLYVLIAYWGWTCVISYDAWRTLTGLVLNSSFRQYSIVAWTAPAVVILVAFIVQKSPVSDNIKPGIQKGSCFINVKRWTAFLYYHMFVIAMFIFCMILFIKVLKYVRQTREDIRDNVENVPLETQRRISFLEFRLFIIMGSFAFGVGISRFLQHFFGLQPTKFSLLDFFIITKGPFIFLMFVCRRSIWYEIRAKIQGRTVVEFGMTSEDYSSVL